MSSRSPFLAVVALIVVAVIAVAAVAGVASRSRGHPARVVAGIRDTVIVNSVRPHQVPLAGIDDRGRAVAVREARFAWLSGDDIEISSAGMVRCPHPATATIRVSAGRASTDFTLYRRPIRDLLWSPGDNPGFVLGQPGRALDIAGRGVDGDTVRLLAARLSVRDSTVASLDGSVVTPRHTGTTWVDAYVGDAHRAFVVQVVRSASQSTHLRPREVFIDRVALVPNQIRSWPVTRGRYEIRFLGDASTAGSVLLAAANANCARYSDGDPHLSCVVDENQANVVMVFRTAWRSASSRPADLTGRMVIRRLADDPSGMDYMFDPSNYPTGR